MYSEPQGAAGLSSSDSADPSSLGVPHHSLPEGILVRILSTAHGKERTVGVALGKLSKYMCASRHPAGSVGRTRDS